MDTIADMKSLMPRQFPTLSLSTTKLNQQEEEAEKQFPLNEIRRNILCEFNNKSVVSDEKLKVFLRVRPFTNEEIKKGEALTSCFTVCDQLVASVIATAPEESASFKNKPKNNSEKFTFSTVFPPNVEQHTVFNTAVLKYVANFVNGANALIFSYGVTSSGKTFTIQGTPERVGVLPRALDVLFNTIKYKQQSMPYRYKPKNFDEIEVLDEAALERVLKEKEIVFRMAINEEDSRMLGRSNNSFHKEEPALSECGSRASTVESACGVSSNCDATSAMASIMTATASRVREATRVLFEGLAANVEAKFTVWVSYYEIYNENVYDLLQPLEQSRPTRYASQAATIVKRRIALTLREDRRGAIFVRDLTCVPVVSADEAYRVMLVGKRNQHVAATQLNQQSSRSHGIFVVRLVREDCNVENSNSSTQITVSQLFLCDLAGSERTTKTQTAGLRLQEASRINSSLFCLGQCIDTLRHNQNHPRQTRPVPYRNSKLTRVFQSFFTGKGRVAMIINMNQCASFYDETLQVLRFSALAKAIVLPCEQPPVTQILSSSAARNKKRSSRFQKLGLCSPRPGQRITIAWQSPSCGSDNQDEQLSMDDENNTTLCLSSCSAKKKVKTSRSGDVDSSKNMDAFFGINVAREELESAGESADNAATNEPIFVSVVPFGSKARLSELAANFEKEELLFIVENLRDRMKEMEQELREVASRVEGQIRKELCDEFDAQVRDMEANFEQRMQEQERLLEEEAERRIKLYMNYAEKKNKYKLKKLQEQYAVAADGGAEGELLCLERERLREAQQRLALVSVKLADAKCEAADFAACHERAVLQCETLTARLQSMENECAEHYMQLDATRQELARVQTSMAALMKKARYRDSSVQMSPSRYLGYIGEEDNNGALASDESLAVPNMAMLMAELHARQQWLNKHNDAAVSVSLQQEACCCSCLHEKEEMRVVMTDLEARFVAKHDALKAEQDERERIAAEVELLHSKLVASELEKASDKRAAEAASAASAQMVNKLSDEIVHLRAQLEFRNDDLSAALFHKVENVDQHDLPRRRALRKRKQ